MILKIKNAVGAFLREEDGVTMVEYALIAGLISVACVIILGQVGTDVNTIFTTIEGKLSSVHP
jgi:pilus assembly protein Flp/PilA